MSTDPNAPVLVGLAQVTRRPGVDGVELSAPTRFMADALLAAAEDAGPGARLLEKADVLAAVPPVAGGTGDPARHVAAHLGLDIRTMRPSLLGGNGPQVVVNALGERIQAGDVDVACVTGAEVLQSLMYAAKHGIDLGWPGAGMDEQPDDVLEADRPGNSRPEMELGMIVPIIVYPLIENALRAAAGHSVAAHQQHIAGLWSRFSEVAAANPHAWTQRAYSAEELAVASDDNRQVSFPYTKLMNANFQVDQAAALIVCSASAAEGMGILSDRWVFLHAGAQATDEWFLSERAEIARSPAIAACGRDLFALAGGGPSDVAHVDLYSCFPSAVQLAAFELGFETDDPARPLTCTGGLTFFGGPGNNYSTHGIAAVAERLRAGEPGERGLSTALGWYSTKHALGLYGNEPPERPFAVARPQAEVDALPGREVAPPEDVAATAETCTLFYGRDGAPEYGTLFALRDDGRRSLGITRDADVMSALSTDDFLGSRVSLAADRSFEPG